ncbi:MAG TPA: hypothetical protein VFQ67_14620 [Allosphingosinicella sp.]|nr:hypothetical protein [Allosphingosinicella sp.]
MATALTLASSLLQPEPEVPTAATDPYRCSVAVRMDGLTGGMWRDFVTGTPDEYYKIQIYNPEIGTGIFAYWGIDNRPPRRPRAYGYDVGVPEAEAFRNGPDSVDFGEIGYGRVTDGAISARLYGDGAYAGTIPVQTAKRTRRVYRLGGQGLALHLFRAGHAEIFSRLAKAGRWEAVLIDPSGREIGRKTIRVPLPAAAQAEFNRARLELLRHRDQFLTRPSWNTNRPCSTFIEERDAPI